MTVAIEDFTFLCQGEGLPLLSNLFTVLRQAKRGDLPARSGFGIGREEIFQCLYQCNCETVNNYSETESYLPFDPFISSVFVFIHPLKCLIRPLA